MEPTPVTEIRAAPLAPSQAALTILCVDDDPSILSSLTRLFRARGYQICVAEGGQAGLALLESQAVDLVLSDMRMPEMDGVQFLEHVRQRWPDTVRLLLTGYADINAIVDAINRGEIHRYITKPWDDNDIVLIVREALEHRALELKRKRLEALIVRQNEDLKAVHARLEDRVAERTAELTQANESLQRTQAQLKTSFITSIKVFTALVELRGGNLAGHARRVADLSRRIALQLALDAKLAQEIFVAGLLHEIGKVGFADELLGTPVLTMNTAQLNCYRQHPTRAQQLLMPLPDLKGAADIIASQLERFDGTGHPRRLLAQDIPVGARILALASDYDNLQIGTLAPRRVEPQEAQAIIVQSSGKRYDPAVVLAMVALFGGTALEETEAEQPWEMPLKASDLEVGMVLSRDLITPSGLLMLSAGHVLDERMIRKVIHFERSAELQLIIHVDVDRDKN